MVAFEIGADDAELFERQISSHGTADNLLNILKYHAFSRPLIDGMPSRPFSFKTKLIVELKKSRRRTICVTAAVALWYTSRMSTTSYLDRMLQPVTEAMSPEFATKLVGLTADSELLSHVEQLRGKANAGTLTAEEDAEYKDFVEAVDVISILQSKARRVLANRVS